jgi:L-iditol 2-dehydrogenase
VVGEPHVGSCRQCALCRSGNPQICPHKRALGTWTDGAFAELVRIPAWLLHRVPARISDPAATLIEPLACVWHGLFERSELHVADRVLIIGHGPIGLLSAHLATRAGASEVIVVGRSGRGRARLEAARALGCEVLDADSEDIERRVAELTDGDGVELVVESAGAASSLTLAVDCARRGGRIVVLGLSGLPAASLPWDRAVQSDLTLAFSFSSRASSREAAIEVAGEAMFPGEALITDTIDLGEWARGLEEIRSGRAVKAVLRP